MANTVTYYPVLLSAEHTTEQIEAAGLTLEVLIKEHLHTHVENKQIWVNDACITDIQYVIAENDIITVRALVAGSESARKNFGGLLVAVAIIVEVASFGTLTGPAIAIAAVGLGFIVGDDVAKFCDKVNAAFEEPDAPAAREEIQDRPDLAGARNSMHAGDKWPIILGKHRISPYLAASYWTDVTEGDDGKDTWLHGLLVVGYGPLRLTDFRLGDMRLGVEMPAITGSNFDVTLNPTSGTTMWLAADDSVVFAIKQSAGPMQMSPIDGSLIYGKKVVEEQVGTEIIWPAENVTEAQYLATMVARMTAQHVEQVSVTIAAGGFIKYQSDGTKAGLSDTFRLMWRPVGQTTWNNFADASSVRTIPNGQYKTEIRYTLTGTYTQALQDAVSGPGLPLALQIEVGVRRGRKNYVNDVPVAQDTYLDTWTWVTCRTITNVEPLSTTAEENLCRIAFKIKATDRMNGLLDQINCIASSVLPVATDTGIAPYSTWNFTKTAWRETANPADIFLAAFRGVWCPVGGINLTTAQTNNTLFSWSALRDLRRWCNESRTVAIEGELTRVLTHQCEINKIVTGGIRLVDFLQAILTPARASFYMAGARYSIVHDAWYNVTPAYSDASKYNNLYNQQVVTAVLSPKNSRNFSTTKSFAKVPDAIKVTIVSSDAGYQKIMFVARNPQLTQAELVAKQLAGTVEYTESTLTGVTDIYQATLYVRYTFAMLIARRTVCSCDVDIEQYFYTEGSRVSIASDVLVTGLTQGRIHSVEPILAAYSITLDEDCEFPTGQTYAIKIWGISTGVVVEATCTPIDPIDTSVGYARTSKWRVPEADVLAYPGHVAPGSYYAIGLTGKVSHDYIVLGKEINSDYSAKLNFVEYSAYPHTAENIGTVPLYVPNILPPPQMSRMGPTAPALPSIAVDGKTMDSAIAMAGAATQAIAVVTQGDPTQPPDTVTGLTVIARREYLEIDWAPMAPGLKNTLKNFAVEISNDGISWITRTPTASEYIYFFNRDVDGYPEKTGGSFPLSGWRVRVKAVNIYGYSSLAYSDTVAPDVTQYNTWIPTAPVLTPYCTGRQAILNWKATTQYGKLGYDVQIARKDTAPLEGDWVRPALTLDPRISEANYTDGAGTLFTSIEQISQSLPLKDQTVNTAKDTNYYYRVRGISEVPTTASPTAQILGAWSGSYLVVARPTGTADLVAGAIGNAQLAAGAVYGTAIATDAIETAMIKDNAVTVAEIANSAVTAAKLNVKIHMIL